MATPSPALPPVAPAPPQAAPPALSFDDLFPATPPQGAPSAEPSAQPQSEVWYRDPETGTVYKTADDARPAIAEKDRYILQLRQELQGIRQAVTGQTPQASQTPILDALDLSVRPPTDPTRDPTRFEKTLDAHIEKMVQERLDQRFGSIAPLIEHAGLQRAVQLASAGPKGDPNIAAFVQSDTFKTLLAEEPTLAQAVKNGQSDPQFAVNQLPDILRYAYLIAKARTGAPAVPQTPQRAPIPGSSTPPTTLSPDNKSALLDIDWATIPATEWAAANASPRR